MAKDPCKKKVVDKSNGLVSDSKVDEIMERIHNMAQQLADSMGWNYEQALTQIAGEISMEGGATVSHLQRNHLLNVKARRRIKDFVKRFKTVGEGILAFLEGSSKAITGARLSVDYISKSIHQKYLGRVVAELEKEGLWHTFNRGNLDREIYMEMGAFERGKEKKSVTGNEAAFKIASIVEAVTDEMVSRQNRAGALIRRVPGYVARQTHDQVEIRRVGGLGHSAENIERSYQIWSDFVLPRLDVKKTFKGSKPEAVLKNIHRSLYTGVHGRQHLESEAVTNIDILGSTAKKVSQPRVLWFRDAVAAYEYNQVFGMRKLRDQILNDVYVRSRSIALMETLGPDVEANFGRVIQDLQEEIRDAKDVTDIGMSKGAVQDLGVQADSLRKGSIESAFQVVTGQADVPVNHSLARAGMAVRTMAILAKMTNVVLSAFSDKAFLNAEMAFQGISRLDTWGKQLSGLFPRHGDQKRFLRYMGAALDGLIGSTITRYTSHSTASAVGHNLQKTLFNVNFMNWWTDVHKAGAVELMSNNLGDHAEFKWNDAPEEIRRVLSLYEIGAEEWDVIRQGIWIPGKGIDPADRVANFEIYDSLETKYVTADAVRKAAEANERLLDPVLDKQKLTHNYVNRQRVLTELETKLRAYFEDRSDLAVPTPGAKEKRISIWGHTRPGTPLGEAARLVMMFKSFPITIMTKIWGRERYARGATGLVDWMTHPRKGFLSMAMLIGSAGAMGYMSGAVKDLLKGRTPKRLVDEDGSINMNVLIDAFQRGGGMGILGDFLFNEYDRHYRTATGALAGPVLGQLDPAAEIYSLLAKGQVDQAMGKSERFFLDNTPFINLFYIRPILDYMMFWSLQEALDPGSLKRVENAVQTRNHQEYWLKPSEHVK